MSDSRQGPSRVGSAMTGPDRDPENAQDGRSIAVLGPFTVRDLAVFAGVLVTFIGSLLPLVQRGTLLNLWNAQNLYFIAIGILLPLVLAGLFVWRRLAPSTSIRVGSLSLDQFGSVVAVFACSYFFVFAVTALTPGGLVGFVGGAVLVAATVLGRFIPGLAKDFAGRPEAPAHVVARDAVAPVVKPKAPKAQTAGPPASAPQTTFPAGAAAAPWAGSLAPDDAPSPTVPVSPPVTPAAGGAAAAAAVAAARRREATRTNTLGTNTLAETPGGAPVGQAADDAVVLGDADGQAYGAPSAANASAEESEHSERVEPVVESPIGGLPSGPTTVMPAAPEGPPETAPAPRIAPAEGAPAVKAPAEAAPAEEAPAEVASVEEAPGESAPEEETPAPRTAQKPTPAPEPVPEPEPEPVPEPEPEVGPATQVAPAVDRYAGFEATRSVEEPEPEYEAFWFAVNQPRTAFDPQSGLPAFTLEPGQWILALQDRGNEFLVQSQDGRVGILRDLSGIERG